MLFELVVTIPPSLQAATLARKHWVLRQPRDGPAYVQVDGGAGAGGGASSGAAEEAGGPASAVGPATAAAMAVVPDSPRVPFEEAFPEDPVDDWIESPSKDWRRKTGF